MSDWMYLWSSKTYFWVFGRQFKGLTARQMVNEQSYFHKPPNTYVKCLIAKAGLGGLSKI